jgi:hypothetical protein
MVHALFRCHGKPVGQSWGILPDLLENHPVPDRQYHFFPIYFASRQAVKLLRWPVLLEEVLTQDDDAEF